MEDLDRIRSVKKRVAAQLHAIPGVHAVGVGAKVVGGKETDELSITVVVLEKKSRDQLSAAELVPSEIEGIKTDVVQRPRVRLANADPKSVAMTIGPLPAGAGSGGIVTLSGQNIPDGGLMFLLKVTVQHAVGAPDELFASQGTNWDPHSLFQVAERLAKFISASNGVIAKATPGPPVRITITANPGDTAQISRAHVLAEDTTKYFSEFLRGGIQIQRGGLTAQGTLGCLATGIPGALDPKGRVFALTNYHVVAPLGSTATNLKAVQAGLQTTFSATAPSVTPETLVVLTTTSPTPPNNVIFEAFYTTAPGDTPAMVAAGIARAGFMAAVPGTTVAQVGSTPVITVTGPVVVACAAFGPISLDPLAKLRASVNNHVGPRSITFSGQIPDDNHGVFVNINPGGGDFTFGVFVNPRAKRALADVATDVAKAITDLPSNIVKKVNATSAGATVSIVGAQEIECRIAGDVQVGQPDHSPGSKCSRCCSHRIGRVVDAQIRGDLALIQLDPDLKYKLLIQDIAGGLKPPVPPVPRAAVAKRGVTSGKTTGRIGLVGMSAEVSDGSGFLRTYEGVFEIQSDTQDPFMMSGDSGSAVVSGSDNSLVGLAFGHQEGTTTGVATEFAELVDAFPALKYGLSFAPAAGTDVNAVQKVPESALAFHAAEGRPALGERLDEAEREIRSTPEGREVADVVRRHFDETVALINENRRVAAVWRRIGGPDILNAFLRVIQFRQERLPADINGRPWADCLRRLQQVIGRYASPAFSADLGRYAPRLADVSRMTYPELLATLQPAITE